MAQRVIFKGNGYWFREADGRVGFELDEGGGLSARGASIAWPAALALGTPHLEEMSQAAGGLTGPGEPVQQIANRLYPLQRHEEGILQLVERGTDAGALDTFLYADEESGAGHYRFGGSGLGFTGDPELVAISPDRVAIYEFGAAYPMVIDVQLQAGSGALLRVITYECQDDADAAGARIKRKKESGRSGWIVENIRVRLEWEGPAPQEIAETTRHYLAKLFPPEGVAELEPEKRQANISMLGIGITRTFWSDFAETLEDPFVGAFGILDHGASIVNKTPMTLANGTVREFEDTMRALLTYSGAEHGIRVSGGHQSDELLSEPTFDWMDDNVPARYLKILGLAIDWFKPFGSALVEFRGNRKSELDHGPAPYFYTPDMHASAHDKLVAFELLEAFLKKIGIKRARIRRLLA